MKYLLGLDLSLRAAALCLVPLDWVPNCDWSRVIVRTVGKKLPATATAEQQVDRLIQLSQAIRKFVGSFDVAEAWVEEYAFSRGDSRAHALGELGGAVKIELRRAGIPIRTAAASTARTNLGRFATRAKKGEPKLAPVKTRVVAEVKRMGAPADWTDDEIDAWVVANHGLIIAGHGGILVPRAA